MDLNKIDQIAFDNMALRHPDPDREPGFIYHHGRRTAQLALRLADQLKADVQSDILYTGALFHDVGKGDEFHNEAGAIVARDLLSGLCQDQELDRICEIVRLHNQRGKSPDYTPEIKLVQDADFLDHVGALGVWLAQYYQATHVETIDDVLRFYHGEERASAIAMMRQRLNYDLSIRIFDQRIDFENRYFLELERVHLQGL